ncbi:hypothetical protein H4N54_25200 [Limnospira fusiformis KN01]|uniref:hypothetical protein n=1 Tax=Limnospira TaxID=2596745 RepID=UPI001CA661C1|nr:MULTISPECIES: hypothetical protein [Limnospira]MDT9198165.1 hypothetical protein [Limnospira sp. PMC 1042.18]ULB45640.1 hypothetical protein H4N54_25200 [Limnospira fusiformis KN01]
MANITISDLHPAGADLFSDSESYLYDLSESEMLGTLVGGLHVRIRRIPGIRLIVTFGWLR